MENIEEDNLLKYVPFLEELIRKLQTTNADNSREAQLAKIVILHDLIKNKKLKPEILHKCKTVIMKLQEKVPVITNPIEEIPMASAAPKPVSSPSKELLMLLQPQEQIINKKKTTITTPDSPSHSPTFNRKYTPFIIPTERTENLFGPRYIHSDIDYRRRHSQSGYEKQSTDSGELFHRRSPNWYTNNEQKPSITNNDSFPAPYKNDVFNVKTEKPERNYLKQSVFKRLGDKVEKPIFQNFKIVKQVASPPIEALRSPPLSNHDIHNLLIENSNKKGLETKDLNGLTELRKQLVSAIEANDSELNLGIIKKKNIPIEEPKCFGVGQPRLAYKYNPHPRKKIIEDEQCELHMDSTFSPKFTSTQNSSDSNYNSTTVVSKIDSCFETIPVPKDPRLRKGSVDYSKNRDLKLEASPLPSSSNISVLNFPAVNYNDPRLNRNKNEPSKMQDIQDSESYSRFRPNLNDMVERKKYEKSKKANRDDEEIIPPTNNLELDPKKNKNIKPATREEQNKMHNYTKHHSPSNRNDYFTNKSLNPEKSLVAASSSSTSNFKIPKIKKEVNVESTNIIEHDNTTTDKNMDNNSMYFENDKSFVRSKHRNRISSNNFKKNNKNRDYHSRLHSNNSNLKQIHLSKEHRQDELRSADKIIVKSNAVIDIALSDSDSMSTVSTDSSILVKTEDNHDLEQLSSSQSVSSDDSTVIQANPILEEPNINTQMNLTNKSNEKKNPEFSSKEVLLQMLSTKFPNKFNEIKQIIERSDSADQTPDNTKDKVMSSEYSIEKADTADKQEKITADTEPINKERKKPKRLNELEKLNEYIYNMGEGALPISGKRLCTLLDENKKNNQKVNSAPTSSTTVNEVVSEDDDDNNDNCDDDDDDNDGDEDDNKNDDDGEDVDTTSTSTIASKKKPRQTSLQAKKALTKQLASKYKNRSKSSKAKDQKKRVLRSSKSELVLPLDIDGPPKKNDVKVLIEKINIKEKKLAPSNVPKPDSEETEVKTTKPKKKRKSQWSTGVIQKKKKKSIITTATEPPKNNNPDIHIDGCMNNTCVYCNFKGNWLVNHYVIKHPKLEVCLSRLTPEIAEEIKENQMSRIGTKVYDKKGINIMFNCFFCNKNKSLSQKHWGEHYTLHTGEYNYKCSACDYRNSYLQQTTNHTKKCNGVAIKIRNTKFEDNHFYGYLCSVCNYVQISKKKLETHIKTQHTDKAEIIKFSLVNYDNKQKMKPRKKPEKKNESIQNTLTGKTNEASDSDQTDENLEVRIIPNGKLLNAFIAPREEDNDDLSDIINLPVPERQKPISIADKLNKRFNIVDQLGSEKNKSKDSKSDISHESDSDIPLIELKIAVNSKNSSLTDEKVIEASYLNSQPSTSKGITETNNDEIDDNEWEDIESSDTENGIDVNETSMPTEIPEKKTNIYLTLNRLFESMKNPSSSKTPVENNVIEEINSTDNTDEMKSSSEIPESSVKKKKPRIDYRELLRIQEKEKHTTNNNNLENDISVEMVNETSTDIANQTSIIIPTESISNPPIDVEKTTSDFYGFSVKNIGYYKLDSKIFFICFYGDCTLKTLDRTYFETHINSHKELWEGFCNICVSTINTKDDLTLFDEYYHLIKVHLKLTEPIDEDISKEKEMENEKNVMEIDKEKEEDKIVPQRPFIKFKMLPGDMLSTVKSTTPPPLNFVENRIQNINPMPITSLNLSALSNENRSTFTLNSLQNKTFGLNASKYGMQQKPNLDMMTFTPGQKINILPPLVSVLKKGQQINILKQTSNSGIKISNVESLNNTILTTNANKQKLINAERSPSESLTNALKPWSNTECSKIVPMIVKMLTEISLLSAFKCMGRSCSYTTSDSNKFDEHLNNHEEFIAHQHVPDLDTMSWLECSYCDLFADNCLTLRKHVVDEHITCIFQCNYCFYRSCTAFNVVVHHELYHKLKILKILVCNGKMKYLGNEELHHLLKSRDKNVRPLACINNECNKKFFIPKTFVDHLADHSGTYFICEFCELKIRKESATRHMLCHGIGIFNCIHCVFGINNLKSMQHHMTNQHPSELLFICVRVLPRDLNDVSSINYSDINSILVAQISDNSKIDNSTLRFCYLTDNELSYRLPGLYTENFPNILIQENIRKDNILLLRQDFSNLDSIGDIRKYKNFIINYLEFKKYYQDGIEEQIKTEAPISASVTTPKKDIISLPMKPSIITTVSRNRTKDTEVKQYTNKAIKKTIVAENEITDLYAIISEIVKKSGFDGEDLYRCSNCPLTYKDHRLFVAHLYSHPATEHKCYHCDYVHKSVSMLGTHIQSHSTKRYFCYSCTYTSSLMQKVLEHYNRKHTTESVKANLDVIKICSNNVSIICPKKTTQNDIFLFAKSLSEKYKEEKLRLKKYYSPEEINDLPRQAILGHEICCSKCTYYTKVRTNMYRHLLFHQNEVSVPVNDPVNPVPCLNSIEKHFDKMANLACSSQDIGRSKTFPDAPKYVAEQQRFVCGAIGCKYQTINSDMLRSHLNTLHSDEQNYKCPHCNHKIENSLISEQVITHLKFHDSNMFKCSKCEIYHYSQQFMKQHVSESHNMIGMVLKVRDETSQQQVSSPSLPLPARSDSDNIDKWICEICKTRALTRALIMQHTWAVHGTKSQYQCGICGLFSTVKNGLKLHFTNKHPRENVFIKHTFSRIDEDDLEMNKLDTTPIWSRDNGRVKSIRGILFEDEENSLVSGEEHEDDDDDEYNPLSLLQPIKGGISLNNECSSNSDSSNKLEGNITFVCLHCIKKCTTLDQLKFHWEISHKMSKTIAGKSYPGRAFLFKIIKIYRCMYCKKSLSYTDIVNHIQRVHPKKRFVTVNPNNLKQCGQCNYQIDNTTKFYDHYQNEHVLTKHDSMDFLTNDFLTELLKLNNGTKYYCELCSYFGDTIDEIKEHSTDSHKEFTANYKEKDNEILYCCPHCKSSNSDDFKIIKHIIKSHGTLYKCNYCDSLFKHTKLITEHNLDVHNKKDKSYSTIGLDSILKRCEMMKIVFSNGLVINKIDARQTKYGSFDEITRKLKELEELNYSDLEPNIGKRKISNSSLEDDGAPKKRQRLIESVDNIKSDQDMEEFEIKPFSNYGKRSKPLNLKDIYTNMNIGGNYVQIPCDRFAELCDIHPKLIVTKIKMEHLDIDSYNSNNMLPDQIVNSYNFIKNEKQ